ncbi:hypothetical protein [Schnuerera sp.]|uniref:hypothetical protein n=1 Tax=Schnuerera sp. TaxID=2794844 RepID=UPI002B707862|nr:hypothetical protein [Schnuerera sp.]HSH36756.1 hypothetical protein [Schnuerera sp.]
MGKGNITIILAIIFVLFLSSTSYAMEEKSILLLIDRLDFDVIEAITADTDFGIGFVNIKTRKPYVIESYYFSIAAGRKIGVNSSLYKGLYKDENGTIIVSGFEDMFKDSTKGIKNVKIEVLGEKIKGQGISYIGDNSSAIVAVDNTGTIKSGEIEVKYDNIWLNNKTNYYLSNSNLLVLSYNIDEINNRVKILKDYIDKFKDYNIIIVPNEVSKDMEYIINSSLVPIIYIHNDDNGMMSSLSTQREGYITLEDIHAELLEVHGEKQSTVIGNKIDIVEEEDNLNYAKNLSKKAINLIWITYLFHGLVYFMQCYSAYYIYKGRKDRFDRLTLFNSFIIINIFISLLMGASSLHINIVLYLFINLLISYIITIFMYDKDINIIGLFATLTYGMICFGIFFYPEMIYNSYIGFNNLFYGARYYGFNNGMMGVLLVSSIISYFFIEDLINNIYIKKLACLTYITTNMIVLSANYGANTGGFLTALALFLIILYTNLLWENRNIKNIAVLILIGIIIFAINMYFDYLSNEKSHAINFLIRIKTFGISEFLDMFIIKAKELIKLTLLPPFSIVIVAQMISLKNLIIGVDKKLKKETYIIFITGIIGFLLNDTGMITFIYMTHYLISLLIYNQQSPSKV